MGIVAAIVDTRAEHVWQSQAGDRPRDDALLEQLKLAILEDSHRDDVALWRIATRRLATNPARP